MDALPIFTSVAEYVAGPQKTTHVVESRRLADNVSESTGA